MEEFRKTKYGNWYIQLIKSRSINTSQGYTEKHHIIPRCLGGSDEQENIVKLTAREHYIAHLLLTKMFPNNIRNTSKMIRALGAMAWRIGPNQERVCFLNSRLFEKLRIKFAHVMSLSQNGKGNSQYNTKWVFNEALMQSKKISINALIESGWQLGRVINWDKYFVQKRQIVNNLKICKQCTKSYINRLKISTFCSAKCRQEYEFHFSPIFVQIIKNGKSKFIKRQDFNAYKKAGWVKMVGDNGTDPLSTACKAVALPLC